MASKKNNLIVFVIRSTWQFFYSKTIVSALCARGYQVLVLLDRKWSKGDSLEKLEEYKRTYTLFDYAWAYSRTDWWRHVLFHTRELLTYRRYLIVKEEDRQSRYYTTRWFKYLPRTTQTILSFPLGERMLASRVAGAFLRSVERVAPPGRAIINQLQALSPACLVASPVNMRFPSCDLEYLKAAKKLGIPTVVPVISWDNLTTKGLLHVWPDRLLVWNDVQKVESEKHQNFPQDRVRIIGAPVFDGWFAGLKTSCSREEFCRAHGLKSEYPIVTYLGSSGKMARDETWIVEALRAVLDRAADPHMRATQIIIRPHPANFRNYERLRLPGVVVVPQKGTLPDSRAALHLFYDSIAHSVCTIIGANTSGIIDATIAGRVGVAILTDQYKATQSDTVHFRQLTGAGALELAKGPEGFPAILKNLLEGRDLRKENRAAFVARYIRPRGLDREVGEVAVDEITKLIDESRLHAL